MNNTEAAHLCHFVKQVCPQQAIDEYTPDAWALLMDDTRIDDAKQAVVTLAKRQPFIAPSDILKEVTRIRNARLAATPPLIPPPGLSDADERRWLADARRAIADGTKIDARAVNQAPDSDHADRLDRLLRDVRATIRRARNEHDAPQHEPDREGTDDDR